MSVQGLCATGHSPKRQMQPSTSEIPRQSILALLLPLGLKFTTNYYCKVAVEYVR
ncbi:hypothetical protein MTR_7g116155 [Medicago truncatula]|uniref:Uncharacterized protein n=1 Tax=Medicago truncatula TaxID=3880 RepID=A0A072UFP6_MEDTR|nr:hypothetical protein MTR_7g116155 [Medicago truncatula]